MAPCAVYVVSCLLVTPPLLLCVIGIYEWGIAGNATFWRDYDIVGGCYLGILCGISISMTLWCIHSIYLKYRRYKFGVTTDAKIYSKYTYRLVGNDHIIDDNGNKYMIKYEFIDNRHGTLTNILVNKFFINISNKYNIFIPNGIQKLCLEFVGTINVWYGPYKVVEKVSSFVYNKCPEQGEWMKLKYDPKYPTNSVILSVEHDIYIIWSLMLFIIGLFFVGLTLWFLIEYPFVEINKFDKTLEVSLLIVLCIIIISIIIMAIVCYKNKSFCCREKGELHVQYESNEKHNDWASCWE
eukprot:342461_1